jgi:hypothetical protein
VPYTPIAGVWFAGSSLPNWPPASVGGPYVARTAASVAHRLAPSDGRRGFAGLQGDDEQKKALSLSLSHTHTHTNHTHKHTHTHTSGTAIYVSSYYSATGVCGLELLVYAALSY